MILASASPRRIELLRSAGYDPMVRPSSYEEVLSCPLPPPERAMFFALGKALDVRGPLAPTTVHIPQSDAPSPRLIIGADTIVVCEDRVLEKPVNKEDALRMLLLLSGNTHQVISGVCLAASDGSFTRCFYESTSVTFAAYTAADLSDYLSTDEPYDKAGAYGIQGTFQKYVERVDGHVDNVIGFPVARFAQELAAIST